MTAAPARVWTDEAALRATIVIAVAAVWTAVVFFGFFPGLISGDPLWQLDQGMKGKYYNVHSPILSWGLGLMFRVSGSVWPALLLQLVTLSGLMGLLAWRSTERFRISVAVLVCFLFVPPVWSTVAAVWKDNAMTSLLLLAIVALLYRKPWWTLALLCLAAAMRLNAALAAGPLLIPMAAQLSKRWPVRVGIVAAAVVAVGATPKLLERALDAEDTWALSWVLTDDLASIYARRPELYPGSMFEKELTAEQMAAIYDVNTSISLFHGDRPHLDLWTLPDRKAELKAEWLRIVTAAPGTYLKARAARFRRLLGLDRQPVNYPFHTQIDPNPYGLELRDHTLLHRALRSIQTRVQNSFLFRGWFWLGLLLVVTVFAFLRHRNDALPLWVAASGLTYAAGYLPLGPAADFRYMYWVLVTVFVTVLLLLGRRSTQPA